MSLSICLFPVFVLSVFLFFFPKAPRSLLQSSPNLPTINETSSNPHLILRQSSAAPPPNPRRNPSESSCACGAGDSDGDGDDSSGGNDDVDDDNSGWGF